MFGLFNKRKPLTVKEIEDGIYAGYLSFLNITEPGHISNLICSYKRIHQKMCPKSQSIGKDELHSSEIYGFVWMYIMSYLKDKGLRVNPNLFERGEYFGNVLDGYVQIARNHSKSKLSFLKFWVSDGVSREQQIQNTLDITDRVIIEELIKKSLLEQKGFKTNIHWYKAIAFSRIINSSANFGSHDPDNIGCTYFVDTPKNCANFIGDIIEEEEVEIYVSFIRNKQDYTTTIEARVW